jgi:hypothetical protein
MNTEGEVRPIIAGHLGDKLPMPPKDKAPYQEIGEFDGSPILTTTKTLMSWFSRGSWHTRLPLGVQHVGEGWIIQATSQQWVDGPASPVLLVPTPEEPFFDFVYSNPGSQLRYANIGGTTMDPLLVDSNGVLWYLPDNERSKILEARHNPDLVKGLKWLSYDRAGVVADVNSLGVLLSKKDAHLLRWGSNFGFENPGGGGGTRIGGTWRNPMVIGNESQLWRLEDPE